jgi:hypothetical protein
MRCFAFVLLAGCMGDWTGSPAWTVEIRGSETHTTVLGSAAPSTRTDDASILVNSVNDAPTDLVLATCDAPMFGSGQIAVGARCEITLAEGVANVTFLDSTVAVGSAAAAVTFEAQVTTWNGAETSGSLSYQFAGSAL